MIPAEVTLPASLLALVVVAVVASLAVAGLLAVRRHVPLSRLEGHDDIVGFIYGAVTVLFAVLAAFVLLAAWEEYGDAEAGLAREAAELAALHRETGMADSALTTSLRSGIREYAAALVADEFPAMRRGGEGREAEAKLSALWRAVLEFEPATGREERWQARILDRLDAVDDQRTLRLLASRSRLPGLLWATLLGGALVTVGSTYLFGTRRVGKHAAMVGILAGTLALVLLVTWSLDRPFSGPMPLAPDAFEVAIQEMDHWEAAAR